jgi:chromosomal replication initiation ATPase DnaA
MHAVKRVEELMAEDREFAQEVELISKLVVG